MTDQTVSSKPAFTPFEREMQQLQKQQRHINDLHAAMRSEATQLGYALGSIKSAIGVLELIPAPHISSFLSTKFLARSRAEAVKGLKSALLVIADMDARDKAERDAVWEASQ